MVKKPTLTKEKIAIKLKSNLGLCRSICEEIVAIVFIETIALTKEYNKLTIQNFGTWKINYKKTRNGFNIHQNIAVNIEARIVLRLIASNKLRQKLNNINN